MKLRKKIAALLATAMIVSVMPMTAFAASTNEVSRVVRVTDDGKTDLPELKITLKNDLLSGEEFYLNLENAEWKDLADITTDSSVAGAFKIERVNETQLAVIAQKKLVKDNTLTIGLNTKDISGEASVEVDPWDTTISKGKYVFATSSKAKASVSVGDAPSFYVGKNNIATLTLEETALGAFKDAGSDNKFEIELDTDDYEFTGKVGYKYTKGFKDVDEDEGITAKIENKDYQKLVFTVDVDEFTGVSQRGVVELEVEVKSTVKKPATGDLNVTISGDLVDEKDLTVATIAEYGVELKSEKDYEFLAGRQEEVTFHLNEIVDDSIVGGRITEFSLPEGVYFAPGSIKLKNHTIDEIENDDDQVTGFEVELDVNADKVDEFEFEAKLDISSDFEGDVVLKAEGRSIGEKLEAVLAKVSPAVKVTVEPMTVKVGMKEQVGGKVIIEELDKGALQQGGEIVVTLEDEKGLYVTDADVDVTAGDLRKGDVDVSETTAGAIVIKVKRRSKEASTIELTNVKLKLDRTVPEGAYELNVGGTAISTLAKVGGKGLYGYDNIVAKDFLFVGEKYTRAEAVFTIGSNVFTVNGQPIEMDAAAYIKDGRTMVPVRYLSYALGIDEDSIKFNSGIVTIFKDDGKVIQLKNGDANLVVNGMTIPMTAAAEIVEGRTYVPVTEIGGVFGVTGTWDAATQTATFK